VKVFEAEHWSRQSFDVSMVLLNDIVQIFALADFDTCFIVSIHLFQARVVRPTLINIHQTWITIFIDGFPQET